MTRPKSPLMSDMIEGTRHFWPMDHLKFSDHKGEPIVIKPGFLSDGLSIPKVFQSIFSKSPSYIFAGILHDYGYRKDFPHDMTRKEVDKLLLFYMKKYGVSWLSRHTIYRAVRLGAMKNWKARNATYRKP